MENSHRICDVHHDFLSQKTWFLETFKLFYLWMTRWLPGIVSLLFTILLLEKIPTNPYCVRCQSSIKSVQPEFRSPDLGHHQLADSILKSYIWREGVNFYICIFIIFFFKYVIPPKRDPENHFLGGWHGLVYYLLPRIAYSNSFYFSYGPMSVESVVTPSSSVTKC